jgi:APA family basic amino acid/polyamine antiporter
MSRRRRQQRLERVLGTPALFSTAYGNVGSSIYYALGVTAVFALGLTPVVFVIAGVIFAATAATYAEGTVRYPEAGGSSSFARHAFNELVSFGAAWAQMLNYIITIAISAFFVPHYLSIFWGPLRENPWDIVGGGIVILLLVTLNIVGIQESANVNIGLALIDFATQVLLVLLGFALIFSPHVLSSNIHWGVAPDVEPVPAGDPGGDDRVHGESRRSPTWPRRRATRSRTSRGRSPSSRSPSSSSTSRCPGSRSRRCQSRRPADGHYQTLLGLGPPEGFSNDPVLGLVENLGVHGTALSALKVYVGLLAATILFIATNAGVIGASRITYAMASYRQLPEVFRRLHKRFKTPYISLLVFAGLIPLIVILPGKTAFLGTMYSFGAMLSFTVAHASIIALRYKQPNAELVFRARPNLRFRGVDWPLFAIFGGLGTALSWLVVVEQEAPTRWAGLGWLLAGFVMYAVYRRRVVHAPLTETVRAPVVIGPAVALEYRNVLVPVVWRRESEAAVDLACRLASERRGSIVALTVLEVPLELPLDADLPGHAERKANDLLDEARAIGDAYGVDVVGRLVRARRAGRAIVEEAERRNSEIVVMGAPRRDEHRRRGRIFGGTVDFVLKNAPCRVMVAAAPRAA